MRSRSQDLQVSRSVLKCRVMLQILGNYHGVSKHSLRACIQKDRQILRLTCQSSCRLGYTMVKALLLLLDELLVAKRLTLRYIWQLLARAIIILAILSLFQLQCELLILLLLTIFAAFVWLPFFPPCMRLKCSEILPALLSTQVGLPGLLKHLKPVERCSVFVQVISFFFFQYVVQIGARVKAGDLGPVP